MLDNSYTISLCWWQKWNHSIPLLQWKLIPCRHPLLWVSRQENLCKRILPWVLGQGSHCKHLLLWLLGPHHQMVLNQMKMRRQIIEMSKGAVHFMLLVILWWIYRQPLVTLQLVAFLVRVPLVESIGQSMLMGGYVTNNPLACLFFCFVAQYFETCYMLYVVMYFVIGKLSCLWNTFIIFFFLIVKHFCVLLELSFSWNMYCTNKAFRFIQFPITFCSNYRVFLLFFFWLIKKTSLEYYARVLLDR